MIVHSLKRAVRTAWTILVGGFSHRSAQQYEMLSARGTMRRAFPELYSAWERERAQGGLWQSADNQFFLNDAALWERFVAHVKGRTNLEIGSGPFGYLAPCYWMKRRVVIDPLIDRYRAYQLERFGKTFWTADIETHAVPAEQIIEQLRGAVDGCIVSRNALDHMEDPLAAIETIAEYAASGCYLLLWTDIWHIDGGDVGHRNITRSASVLDKMLDGLGFDIIQNGASIRGSDRCIEYGRLARKR
ncbi:MAG TPA: hypothetical protein VEK73_08970 [Xanthobacteraceae bacterium]|nr:hypothetical protein [Xanthobacteraceae bacterium]